MREWVVDDPESPVPCYLDFLSKLRQKKPLRIAYTLWFWMSVSLIGGWWNDAGAQDRLGVPPPRRPGPVEPGYAEEPKPDLLPRPILPPIPIPGEPGASVEAEVFVKQIRVLGSTVFSAAQLGQVTQPYVGRYTTSEELEALRLALTRLYVENGYVTSGAILPDQTVTDGVITFRIVEGELTDVIVSGNRWFRTSYIQRRLALDVEPPLHIDRLQERLQLLRQDTRFEQIHAELKPADRLGESTLHVRVQDNFPISVALEFNNYQAPSIGAERGLITIRHQNVTGHGDVWRFTYGRSAGLDLQLDTSYTLPLSPRDTTISLQYRRNSSAVVEGTFEPLDIESRSEIFTLTLRHPFYRTLEQEFALSLSAERLYSKTTFLRGIPFQTLGVEEDGEATVTAIRFSQEWINRSRNQVIAIRSRFSLGIDALGATINESGDVPTGRFVSWLGQLQWGRRLNTRGIQLLFRLDTQVTTEPLLSLEQMAIGGRFSVRGYPENQLVRDHGLLISLEVRVPLIQNKPWADFVQIIPFADFGYGRNQKVETPDPTLLASVGVGLRWATQWSMGIPLQSQFELFWGYRLREVGSTGGGLQNKGLHLQFVVATL